MKNSIKEMFRWKHWEHASFENLKVLLRWCVFAVITGIVIGVVGTAFHYSLTFVSDLRTEHSWIVYLAPLGGLFVVWFYKVTGMEADKGTSYILISLRDSFPIKLIMAPLIFIGTVVTHLVGGSAGREGAAIQLGGSISYTIGRWMKLHRHDEKVIIMAGMAAGFAALFGTPIAAAVFTMEVVNVGVLYYTAIVPCFLSALIARMVAGYLGVENTTFQLLQVPEVSAISLLQTIGLGILCALVAILFCFVMHLVSNCYSQLTKNTYVYPIIAGVIIIAGFWMFGMDYCGGGMDIIYEAVDGTARPEAFIMKIILTAVTLMAGMKGGEIVPSFFIGATFGCIMGPLIGLPASFAAGMGMVTVFCGVTNCPLTSIFFAYEMFGSDAVPLIALGIAVSYLMSGYWGMYGTQQIVFSKIRGEKINRRVH